MQRVLLLVAALLVTSCGPDEAPEVEIPSWAKVAPEQIAEAKKHGVPVAFENDLGMRFVLIPAGTFLMGSPEDEDAWPHPPEEFPPGLLRETRHEVTLTHPFYMSICEVTNGQYRHHANEHNSGASRGHSLNGDDQPVVFVSWADATAFARWLSRGGRGVTYRLPTEAEWEYACRASTTTRFSWGHDESEAWRYANGYDSETHALLSFTWVTCGEHDDGYRVSAPVGAFRSNGWGLYDMHGNVWEWCADWHGAYALQPTVNPAGPLESGKIEQRVLRGGAWGSPSRELRSADRFCFAPDLRRSVFGFRLVSPLPEPGERGR